MDLQFPGAIFRAGASVEQGAARAEGHFPLEGAGGEAAVDVALAVKPQPDGRRVVWNPRSPVFRTATRGQLVVRSADGDKTVPLDLDQLRAGWLLYSDATGSVRFSLEIRQMAGSVVMETVESEAGR